MTIRKIASRIKSMILFSLASLRFKTSSKKRFFLSAQEFDRYVSRFQSVEAKSHWNYSESEQIDLAQKRLEMLLKVNGGIVPETVCEIGPGSGKLLQKFADAGVKTIYGVDIQRPSFDDERIKFSTDGVHDMKDIEDESVDFLFSIDAFEHIPDPLDGLKKCFRKVKPGGKVYLQIGPTYYSPWGFHYYHILKIPYVQILFPREYLEKYAHEKSKLFPWTNGIAASSYIEFLNNLPQGLQLMNLKYDYMLYAAGNIVKHPDIFRAKEGVSLDDYFIGAIYATIKKSDTSEYLR